MNINDKRRRDKLIVLAEAALGWSRLSTCDRLRVGAVIFTDDFHQVSQGYNGSLPGFPHCDQYGHEMVDGHCIRTLHAESNALSQAKKYIRSTEGLWLLSTHHPCLLCTKEIIRDRLAGVYYLEPYGRDNEMAFARAMYSRANVQIQILKIG
jgi:dCMP deaminase